MADVLIKGMDMPTMPETFKQAERVPYIDVRIFADGTAVTSKCERPYYTQYSAVPVPPHGFLIDEDAFRESILKAICEECDGDCKRCKIMDVLTLLDYAPTIIGASEVKE